MEVSLNLQTRTNDWSNSVLVSRRYGYVNRNFVRVAPFTGDVPSIYIDLYEYPDDDEEPATRTAVSYSKWLDYCGKAIAKLSRNSYVDGILAASWSVNELNAGGGENDG